MKFGAHNCVNCVQLKKQLRCENVESIFVTDIHEAAVGRVCDLHTPSLHLAH